MLTNSSAQQSTESLFSSLSRQLTGYMPELDGLRGIAILLVIAHNLGIPNDPISDSAIVKLARMATNSGWVGVQLFFVLSGFLITGLLLQEQTARPRPLQRSLRDFYIRRILRIFPLYYITLFVLLVLFPILGIHAKSLEGPQQYQAWYWTFMSNWGYAWHDLGGSFAHFWSLAVEEQFYLLWPLFVLNLRLQNLKRLCIGIVIIATIFRITVTLHSPEFAVKGAYTFSVARFDALAIGALLAITMRDSAGFRHLQMLASPSLWAGLAFILIVGVFCHNFGPVVAIENISDYLCLLNQTVASIVSVAFIFYALVSTSPSTPAARWKSLLKHKILQSIGKYSFAMYVFHMPFINFWHWLSGPWLNVSTTGALALALIDMIGVTSLSLLLAMLSWRVLEQPCLRLKSKLAPRRQAVIETPTQLPANG